MRWKKVTLAGVGLLGGSLGMALKQRHLAETVIGLVRREASIAECLEIGAVDQAISDPEAAASGADLVVLCTPVSQMKDLLNRMAPGLKPGVLVTDVGSVKRTVVSQLEPIAARAGGHFIGSHPMAGSEKPGVSAARPDLFQNAVCVLTPTKKTNAKAFKQVSLLWTDIGAAVLSLTPRKHDLLVSRTSHLPHILAVQLSNLVLGASRMPEQARLCANGFRDASRMASGSPDMWRDIVLGNSDHLSAAIDEFIDRLSRFSAAVKRKDAPAISKVLEAAKGRRDAWAANALAQTTAQ